MTGEQAKLQLWMEVVMKDGEPTVQMTPVSDAMWLAIKRDILATEGITLEEDQRVLSWSGLQATILYNSFTPAQTSRLEDIQKLELGENAKIQITRGYRDVILNYKAQYA